MLASFSLLSHVAANRGVARKADFSAPPPSNYIFLPSYFKFHQRRLLLEIRNIGATHFNRSFISIEKNDGKRRKTWQISVKGMLCFTVRNARLATPTQDHHYKFIVLSLATLKHYAHNKGEVVSRSFSKRFQPDQYIYFFARIVFMGISKIG